MLQLKQSHEMKLNNKLANQAESNSLFGPLKIENADSDQESGHGGQGENNRGGLGEAQNDE